MKSVLLRHVAVLMLGGVLFFALGPQAVRHPSQRLGSDGDAILNAWIMAWDVHALTHALKVWDAPIFFPAKNALAFSETMFGNLWIALPVQLLTDDPILMANAVTFAAFVLTMYTTFLLVQGVTGSYVAGIIAGILFSFNPLRWNELPHIQLLPMFWGPLAVWCCQRFLETRRARPFFGMVLSQVALFYTSINLGMLQFVMLLVFVAVHCLLEQRGWQRLFFVTDPGVRRIVLAGLVLAVALLLPLMLPYRHLLHTWQCTRSEAENATFSCEPLSLLVPPSSFAAYARIAGPWWEKIRNCCGLGLVPWLLAAIGVLAVRRNPERFSPAQVQLARRATWMVPIFAVLMLGPNLIWFNRTLPIPMPYLAVFHGLPGAQAVRTPIRYFLPLLLTLSILAGFGVVHLQHLWRNGAWRCRSALVLGLALWLGVDYSVANMEGWRPPTRETPAVYAYLAEGEPDRPVLELPTHNYDVDYLFYQTKHWRPLVTGVSGSGTPAVLETWARTAAAPTDATLSFLRLCPAMTIVIHLDQYDPARAALWEHAALERHGFCLARRFGNDLVWERQGEPIETAARLKVARLESRNSRRWLMPRLGLTAQVTAHTATLPWRCLEQGFETVEITLTDAEGVPHSYRRRMDLPAYLLSGETAMVAIESITGVPKAIRHIAIRAPLMDDFHQDVDWNQP